MIFDPEHVLVLLVPRSSLWFQRRKPMVRPFIFRSYISLVLYSSFLFFPSFSLYLSFWSCIAPWPSVFKSPNKFYLLRGWSWTAKSQVNHKPTKSMSKKDEHTSSVLFIEVLDDAKDHFLCHTFRYLYDIFILHKEKVSGQINLLKKPRYRCIAFISCSV